MICWLLENVCCAMQDTGNGTIAPIGDQDHDCYQNHLIGWRSASFAGPT
jgi:hypothetical protein